MPFSSPYEFKKWYESIQYRYNAGAQTGLPSPGGRTKAVAQHTRRASSRPHASQPMAKRGGYSGPSVPSEHPLQPSSPPLPAGQIRMGGRGLMRCSCGTETVKRRNWAGALCDYCPTCKKFVSFAMCVGVA